MSWHHRMSKHQTWKTFYLESKHCLVMKFGQFMQHYKIKFFIKKFCEKCGLETSSRPFLIFKESSVKRNWGGQHTNLDKLPQLCYYISNICGLLQKFHFPIKVVLNSLQTQKSLDLVSRLQLLQKFLRKYLLL